MEKNNDKPKLRFPGFTDPWEQRKFDEIFEISQGLQIAITERYSEPGENRFFYITNEFLKSNCEEKYYIYNPSVNVICDTEDILMTRTGNTGIVVTDVNGCFHNNFFKIKYDKKCFDKHFICQFLSSSKMQKRILSSAGSSTIPDLSHKSFYKLDGLFPEIGEQKKISKLFTNLDNLITLHQRKLNHLQDKKKSLLQKMFTKKGQYFPELRFPGFTDPWEQRKLSEVATMHARIGWQNLRTSEFLDSGEYMLITGTDFEDGAINYSTCHYVEKERYDQDKHIQITNGSILITKDGTLGKVAYVQGLTMPATLNAGVFNVEIKDDNDVDGKYLFQYLKAPYLMDYVAKKATGGTIKHLNQNILVEFPVLLPNKEEQIRIGNYFQDIDNLITLHQRKLNNLKEQKKALLQQMFV
jgi:type I restriction enzyme S subunit